MSKSNKPKDLRVPESRAGTNDLPGFIDAPVTKARKKVTSTELNTNVVQEMTKKQGTGNTTLSH
jgi:hypothetical protein